MRRRMTQKQGKTVQNENVTNSFKYQVGSINVTVVSDGYATVPLVDDFVLNAPVSIVQDALATVGMPTDTLTTTFSPVVVESAGQRILIDAGLGPDAAAQPGATAGQLVANMRAVGITPESIDEVIITHFHPDHVNGLLAHGEPVYPNAKIRVPRVEWDFWNNDQERAQATPGRMQSLFENNHRIFDPLRQRVSTFEWEEEVIQGLIAIGAPGHSIGHTCFEIVSDGKKVFLQSDLTNHAVLFMPNPHWTASFDQNPEQTVATRIKIYDRLAAEGTPVQAFHHAFPGLSVIVKEGQGYRLEPVGGV